MNIMMNMNMNMNMMVKDMMKRQARKQGYLLLVENMIDVAAVRRMGVVSSSFSSLSSLCQLTRDGDGGEVVKVDGNDDEVRTQRNAGGRATPLMSVSPGGESRLIRCYNGNVTCWQSWRKKNFSTGSQNSDAPIRGTSNENTSETSASSTPVSGSPISWLSLILALGTGSMCLAFYRYELDRKMKEVRKLPSTGRSLLGGPFHLKTIHKKEGDKAVASDAGTGVSKSRIFTEKDLVGQWSLLYFGFTFCPDICPAELEKLAAAVDKIKKSNDISVTPIFISIDPERDSLEQVDAYVKGTVEECAQAARQYRVYYSKAMTGDDEDDYLVDHSIIMYLIDPNGEFVKFFGKNESVETLSKQTIEIIQNWQTNVA